MDMGNPWKKSFENRLIIFFDTLLLWTVTFLIDRQIQKSKMAVFLTKKLKGPFTKKKVFLTFFRIFVHSICLIPITSRNITHCVYTIIYDYPVCRHYALIVRNWQSSRITFRSKKRPYVEYLWWSVQNQNNFKRNIL